MRIQRLAGADFPLRLTANCLRAYVYKPPSSPTTHSACRVCRATSWPPAGLSPCGDPSTPKQAHSTHRPQPPTLTCPAYLAGSSDNLSEWHVTGATLTACNDIRAVGTPRTVSLANRPSLYPQGCDYMFVPCVHAYSDTLTTTERTHHDSRSKRNTECNSSV